MIVQPPHPPAPLRHHAELVPPQPTDVLVGAAPGPDGQLVALWCAPEVAVALQERRTAPNGVRYSPTVLDRPVEVRVTTYDPGPVHTTRISDLSLPSPHVQPLPGGRILLVAPRCRWYGDHADRNAVVYDSDGRQVGDGVLGDGVGRLATTSEGRIWAGYFDEGVFGNYGWGGTGPDPIGAPGLVCFDDGFRPIWSFPSTDLAQIVDCYCLNVSGEAAWACYYDGFPIVRADGAGATGWRSDGTEGFVLLVAEATGRVALFSGYGAEHRDRVRIGSLGDGTVRWEADRWVVLPDGTRLPDSLIHGRGSTLHVAAGTSWYQLDLHELT